MTWFVSGARNLLLLAGAVLAAAAYYSLIDGGNGLAIALVLWFAAAVLTGLLEIREAVGRR